MRRLGLAVWAVCLAVGCVGCTSTVHGTAVARDTPRASTPAPAHGLPALLLSLDEMKQVLKFSGLVTEQKWRRPDPRGIFRPDGCVGAVFSGMAGSYDGSGYRDFYEVRQQDLSLGGWSHWVDQGVAAFDNAEAAKGFVVNQVTRWRQCTGRQFSYAFPYPNDWRDPYVIGDTVDSGCVTMISSVIARDKRYTDIRVLAAKSNLVVDLQFTGFDLTDEPMTATTRILDRIASGGRDCAFWG
jgi:PknH-like extracellular domain